MKRSSFHVVGSLHIDRNAAAGAEMSLNDGVTGGAGRNNSIQDPVDGLFMECVVVAEREEKEFQRLALNTELIGDIAQNDVAEVGLIGHRTERGEFRTIKLDLIIPVGINIVKNFEMRLIGRLGITPFGS